MVVYEFEFDIREPLGSLAAWARRPENVWCPGCMPPGSLEERRRLLPALEATAQGTRPVLICVLFTHTRTAYGLMRHASVSMTTSLGAAAERPPDGTIEMICKLLGFRGGLQTWIMQPHPGCAAVSVLEPLELQ